MRRRSRQRPPFLLRKERLENVTRHRRGVGAVDPVLEEDHPGDLRVVPGREEDEHLLAQTEAGRRVIVLNKSDLPAALEKSRVPSTSVEPGEGAPATTNVGHGGSRLVDVSAKTGDGFDELRGAMVNALTGEERLRDSAVISNMRHIALLEQARERLKCAQQSVAVGDTPEEFVLTDLQAARAYFDEIVGTRTPDDVLEHIFETFCIGK